MIRSDGHPGLQVCTCDAMNTTFTFRLDCADAARAKDASSACCNQLEELEAQLSRFRHDSDVTRINHLQAGQTLYIAETTHACLMQAAAAQAATAGLFDATLGGDAGQLELAPDRPMVTCLSPGRQVDLGGIGKGFALDQLARALLSHQVDSALLSAGASTQLAVGAKAWAIMLNGDGCAEEVALQGRALSASGTGIQGAHVIHPDHPDRPDYAYKRVWVIAATAALADAFSTACLLMDAEEILGFAQVQGEQVQIFVEDTDSTAIRKIQ